MAPRREDGDLWEFLDESPPKGNLAMFPEVPGRAVSHAAICRDFLHWFGLDAHTQKNGWWFKSIYSLLRKHVNH